MYLRGGFIVPVDVVRCTHMNRIEHTQEGPNIAGVSLALYLLVSLLSMMAAYEVGKASDDFRNSVVISLQSSHTAPNKSGDDDRGDLFIVPAAETIALDARPLRERVSISHFPTASIPRAFNARAPPLNVQPA